MKARQPLKLKTMTAIKTYSCRPADFESAKQIHAKIGNPPVEALQYWYRPGGTLIMILKVPPKDESGLVKVVEIEQGLIGFYSRRPFEKGFIYAPMILQEI